MSTQIILLIAGTICTTIWAILHFAGCAKYGEIIAKVDKKTYVLPELCALGFLIIGILRININEIGAKKKQKLEEIGDKRYVDFQYYILLGAKIGFIAATVPLGIMFAAVANEPLIVLLFVIMGGAIAYYFDNIIESKIKKQRDELQADFPNVLSKLALLLNAGMMLRNAWATVAESGDRKIYVEMRAAIDLMNCGATEIEAYTEFAARCKIGDIRKFISMVCQNIENGSASLVHDIKAMSVEAWQNKKHLAKRKGEAASSLLMIPVMMIFLGILLMVMIPMMSGMSL